MKRKSILMFCSNFNVSLVVSQNFFVNQKINLKFELELEINFLKHFIQYKVSDDFCLAIFVPMIQELISHFTRML